MRDMGVARANTAPCTWHVVHLARAALAAFVAVVAVVAVGCATTTRVDPGLYEARSLAVASLYARKDIWFENVTVAPVFSDNELGDEALEMELGEIEGRLGEIFGVDVVPAGKALESRAYDALPEVVPSRDWTHLNDMIPVDIDLPEAVPALAALARDLGVDAVVVVRHEWSVGRDRFDVAETVTAFDRCALLVVSADGQKLWHDTVVARVPVHQTFAGAYSVGMNGATWADEARQLARSTSREALELLARRYREGRSTAAATPGSSS